MDAAVSALDRWDNFYVIVGSSAAALTGLQFVVMAIVADVRGRPATSETVDAFGTPNVVHFSAVLLFSAIMAAPWPSLDATALTMLGCGGAGVVYALIVVRRARRQTGYEPVLEDWIWHAVLPLAAYSMFVIAAATLLRHETAGLFAIAIASLLLLFVGIHNAWDTVTYIALGQMQADADRKKNDR